MSESIDVNFCIVGTGFSGTAAFVHLVENLVETQQDLRGVCIYTVEPRAFNGPGLPYSDDETISSHLCNNQACKMAIKGNDFVDWLGSNKKRIIARYPHLVHETHPGIELQSWEPDEDAFYPRQLFGIYLQERFLEACFLAESYGICINNLNGYRAVDGYQLGDSFVLMIEALATKKITRLYNLDKVLLSTGHWSPKSSDDNGLIKSNCYLSSPYPANRLKHVIHDKMGRGERLEIFVQGMGPSGIDAILTAADSGRFLYSSDGHVVSYEPDKGAPELRITAASRSGFFPAARGGRVDYEFMYLTEDTYEELEASRGEKLGLPGLLSLLDAEMKEGTKGQVVLEQFFVPKFDSAYEKLKHDASLPIVNDVVHAIVLKARRLRFYRNLDPEEKRYYDRFLDTHFIRTAVPIPLVNAEKLIALIEAGVLKTVTLGYDSKIGWSYHSADSKAVAYGLSDNGKVEFDLSVNSSGQDFHLEDHPSPFIQALLKRGEIVSHEEGGYCPGGIKLDGHDTYRVVKKAISANAGDNDAVHVVSSHLYSLGVPTRFWQNERNFAAAITEASSWISSDWTNHFLGVNEEQASPPDVETSVS